MSELTKEEEIKYLHKVATEFQKPLQYQLMALEQILIFEKNKML